MAIFLSARVRSSARNKQIAQRLVQGLQLMHEPNVSLQFLPSVMQVYFSKLSAWRRLLRNCFCGLKVRFSDRQRSLSQTVKTLSLEIPTEWMFNFLKVTFTVMMSSLYTSN